MREKINHPANYNRKIADYLKNKLTESAAFSAFSIGWKVTEMTTSNSNLFVVLKWQTIKLPTL